MDELLTEIAAIQGQNKELINDICETTWSSDSDTSIVSGEEPSEESSLIHSKDRQSFVSEQKHDATSFSVCENMEGKSYPILDVKSDSTNWKHANHDPPSVGKDMFSQFKRSVLTESGGERSCESASDSDQTQYYSERRPWRSRTCIFWYQISGSGRHTVPPFPALPYPPCSRRMEAPGHLAQRAIERLAATSALPAVREAAAAVPASAELTPQHLAPLLLACADPASQVAAKGGGGLSR